MKLINSTIIKQGTEEYEGFAKHIKSKFDYTFVKCECEDENDDFYLLIISQPRDRNYRGTSITNGYEIIRDKIFKMGLLSNIPIEKVKWFDHYERSRGDRMHSKQDITLVSFNENNIAEFGAVIYTEEFKKAYFINIETDLNEF